MSKIFVAGSNALFGKCEICSVSDEELRPYRANGENICFKCAMKDEEMTGKRFLQTAFGEGFDA